VTNWPPLAVTAIGMWELRQSGQLAYLFQKIIAARKYFPTPSMSPK